MISTEFIHPEDAKALAAIEKIPGARTLMKKFLELGYEKMYYGENMASQIRLSPTQMPHIYKHLPPICEKLGIEEPEFYLEMNPFPNAGTYGDTQIFISVTSGLIETMNDDELDAVLAHECGHIMCRHVLYHSLAKLLLKKGVDLGLLGDIATPLLLAIFYWHRKSELSCDRVAALVTSPETVASFMARLAGGPRSITDNINLQEWAAQADKYDEIYNDGLWNKTLMVYNTMLLDHPYAAVRVREVLNWAETEQYARLKASVPTITDQRCQHCGRLIDTSWKYCRNCGNRI